MALHLEYRKPPSEKLQSYVSDLYARRSDGVIARRVVISSGNWLPIKNQCHKNVEDFVRLEPTYTAVHGWLVIEGTAPFGFVRFVAHSVVRDNQSNLIDITPVSNQIDQYPFIEENPPYDQFIDAIDLLVSSYGSSNCLDYLL